MQRHLLSAALVALLAVAATACSKDNDSDTASGTNPEVDYKDYFTATIAPYNNTKTYIETSGSTDYSCWADGDHVTINSVERAIEVDGGGEENYTARIGADEIAAVNDGWLAAYPAEAVSMANSVATFTIADTVRYTTIASGAGAGQQVVEAPMVAWTSSRDLTFENVGLLTMFALTKTGSSYVTVQKIVITSDQPLSGTYAMRYNNGAWERNTEDMDGYSRALKFDSPLVLSTSAQEVYLPLMPISGATSFSVDIYCTIDDVRFHFSKTKSGSISLNENKTYDFGTLTINTSDNSLSDGNVAYTKVTPTGTEDDPYLIGNAAEWRYWCSLYATTSTAHFMIERDFSTATTISEFDGTLDGNNKTITLSNCCLIEKLNGGTVKNLTTTGTLSTHFFVNTDDDNRKQCGSVAAFAYNATLSQCTSTTTINITSAESGNYDLGGIVGRINHCTVDKCINRGDISTTGSFTSSEFHTGGVVGSVRKQNSTIRNCANSASIYISARPGQCNSVGGVVGYIQGTTGNTLSNSYNTGTIRTNDASNHVGALIGIASSSNTIQNCYNYNDNNSYFCAKNSGNIRYCYHNISSQMVRENDDGTTESNQSLNSATQVSGGTAGAFYSVLNDNITTLGLSGAERWKNSSDGQKTILDFEE